MKWMDFNRDGKVDAAEEYLGMEMLCSSREEHEALFGDAGDFDDELDDDDEFDDYDEDDYDDYDEDDYDFD